MRKFTALVIGLLICILATSAHGAFKTNKLTTTSYDIGNMRTISSYSTFALAIAGAGTDYDTLVGSSDSGTVTVTTDTTIPSTITFMPQKGFKLTYQDANVDLTINGPVIAGPYQWIDPNRNWVTLPQECEKLVQWWGAAGDGSTDDLKPFLRLTEQYGKLTVPYTGSGYKISNEVAINHGNFWLNIEDNITSTNTDPNNMFYIYGTAGSYIEDIKITGSKITLDGNGSNVTGYTYSPTGSPFETMYIAYAKYVQISGIHFDDGLVSCLTTAYCNELLIDDCRFSNSVHDNGCHITGNPTLATDNDPNVACVARITNCVAYDCEDYGFTAFNSNMVTFENCTVDNCGNEDGYNNGGGFSTECHASYQNRNMDNRFLNCKAYNCMCWGFHVTSNGTLIDSSCKAYNITVPDPNQKTDTYGVFGSGIYAYSVEDLTISGEYWNNEQYGIIIRGYTDVGYSKAKIINANCSSNTKEGIRALGVQNLIISGCQLKSNTEGGIEIDNTASGFDPNNAEMIIENCFVENNGDIGIKCQGVASAIISDNVVIDSPLTTNTQGLYFASLTDLYCYDNTALDIDPNNVMAWGIYITNTVTNAHLSGNRFKGFTGQQVYITGSTAYYDLTSFIQLNDIVWPLTLKNVVDPNSYTHGVGMKLKLGTDSETAKWAGVLGKAESTYANDVGLAFYTRKQSVGNPREVARITYEGKVGIGTTTPDDMFEIELDPNNANCDIEFGKGSTDTDISFMTLRDPNGTKFYIYITDGNVTCNTSKP